MIAKLITSCVLAIAAYASGFIAGRNSILEELIKNAMEVNKIDVKRKNK